MFQRMANFIDIPVEEVDLTTCGNVEVCFEQRSTDTEFVYTDEQVEVMSEHIVRVIMPKEDAMLLDHRPIRYQVMYTTGEGIPTATKIYTKPVDELLKEDGYGD